jgi:hypothetical protein
MWVNPSSATFGAASPPSETLLATTAASATELSAIASFALRDVNTVGNPSVLFDELRLGTDWASVTPVVPEASSFVAFGLSGIFAVAAIRIGKRCGLSLNL